MSKESAIRSILADFDDPNLDGGLDADIVEGRPTAVTLKFAYPARSAFGSLRPKLEAAFAAGGIDDIRLDFRCDIHTRTVQGGVERLPGVKNIIAVASAKGGVGKSTVAANMAVALAQEGATVGLLDADIHGPSLPVMFGVKERPEAADGGILPIKVCGIRLMSVGFLVEAEQPMAWRGPMATRALVQLLRDTRWDGVDYLLLDMPPGTGDIQLTVAQQIPVTGAVVVTTPQALAVADARRGITLFSKVSIPVLGLVENMGAFICPHCHKESSLFGSGGGEALCAENDLPLLAKLPLDGEVGLSCERGVPIVEDKPDGAVAEAYRRLAVKTAVAVAHKTRDRSAAFPDIVVSE